MATTPLAAQVVPSADSHGFHLSAAGSYSPVRFRELSGNSFWVQGGGIQVAARKGDHLGLVADARGFHTSNINSSGVGLDLITVTGGPRYSLSFAQHKVSVFGQGLAGGAMAFNGLFPHLPSAQTTASSFAWLAGGGVDMRFSHRFAVRAIEANWMHTQLPNGAGNEQSALILGAGIVYHFR
jgi:hypothetical protein